jgi:hypothetical protein
MHATLTPRPYVLVHRKCLMLRIARRLFSQAQKSMLIQNLRLNWKKSMKRSEKRRAWRPKIEDSISNGHNLGSIPIPVSIPVLYLANYDLRGSPTPCPRKPFPVSCTVPKRPPTPQAFPTMEGQQRHNFL